MSFVGEKLVFSEKIRFDVISLRCYSLIIPNPLMVCDTVSFQVADDGYGVSYIIAGEDIIFFHISSKRSCDLTVCIILCIIQYMYNDIYGIML